MAEDKPGLTPRKLEAEVSMDTGGMVPDAPANVEEPIVVDTTEQAQVGDNTPATEKAEGQDETPKAQEQPSERETNRVQALANRTAQAEARAAQAENMLRGLVNAQVATAPSQEEVLAKQFKSFDPNVGYPTDPREFAVFNAQQAALAARQVAQQESHNAREQSQIADLLRDHPEVASDDALMGAIVAERAAAQKQGVNLTLSQAATKVSQKMKAKYDKEAAARDEQDTQEKNEAYVETSKGASPSRTLTQPEFKSLAEMERWMKENGTWNDSSFNK